MSRTGKKLRWTAEMEQLVRDRYPLIGCKRLAAEMGIGESPLKQKAFALKIPDAKYAQSRKREEVLVIIRARYPDEGPNKLAEELGIKPDTVTAYANRMGLRLNPRGAYRRAAYERSSQSHRANYDRLDVHFFDAWAPDMAYILGYTWADGCVRAQWFKKEQKFYWHVTYQCVATDRAILDFIKRSIRAEAEITYRPAGIDRRGVPYKARVALRLCHTPLARQLAEQYGIEPRKTYKNLPFPDGIPEAFFPHFVRGYLDGDGYVSRTQKGYCRAGLVGSPRWLEGLRDALVARLGIRCAHLGRQDAGNGHIRAVEWSARADCLALYHFLYPPGNGYFWLRRKRDRFEKYLGLPPS